MHHVVLFVLQDVTVPHVFFPPVRGLSPAPGCRQVPAAGRSHLAITSITSPGYILTVSFQPRSLASGRPGRAGVGDRAVIVGRIKGPPGDDLGVLQMDVHGVGVAGEIGDAPDFRRPVAMVSPWRQELAVQIRIAIAKIGLPLGNIGADQLGQAAISIETLVQGQVPHKGPRVPAADCADPGRGSTSGLYLSARPTRGITRNSMMVLVLGPLPGVACRGGGMPG